MVPRHITLEQVRVAEACPKAWSEMTGDAQRRYCAHCEKHVHNLSAMTRSQAQKLLCEAGGALCVLYEQSPDGTIRTLDYAPPPSRWGWRRFVPIVTLASLAAGMLSFVGYRRYAAPPMIMGLMVAPPTTPVVTPIATPTPTPGSRPMQTP